MFASEPGKEAYVEPVIENGGYRFPVKSGNPTDTLAAKNCTKLARGAKFKCLMSNAPMDSCYVRGEFRAQRAGERMMAIVAEGERERVHLAPTQEMEAAARQANSVWRPEQEMNQESSNLVSGRGYGIHYWNKLFTERRLAALTTFSDLVQEPRVQAVRDALAAGQGAGKPIQQAILLFLHPNAEYTFTDMDTLIPKAWEAGGRGLSRYAAAEMDPA